MKEARRVRGCESGQHTQCEDTKDKMLFVCVWMIRGKNYGFEKEFF
jgi:hypothetical protein